MRVRKFIKDIEKMLPCRWYKDTCTSCKHWHDDSGYCDDCTFTESKWEDAYEH